MRLGIGSRVRIVHNECAPDCDFYTASIDDTDIKDFPSNTIFEILDIMDDRTALLCVNGVTHAEKERRIAIGISWVELDHLTLVSLLKRRAK